MQLVDLAIQRLHEQPHECAHFFRGTAPVFAAEGKERQRLVLALHAFTDAHSHRLYAFLVTSLAWQATRAGPTAIAVHDDRDVTRQAHRHAPSDLQDFL